MNKLKETIKKNKLTHSFLKKTKSKLKQPWKFISLLLLYCLKVFNLLRRKNCNKHTMRCLYDIKNINYNYTVAGKDTPICCMTHLYEITRDVTHILNKNNIEYFIVYGTLLGQVRHKGGFIPWDTDVDIAIHSKYKSSIVKILKASSVGSYNIQEIKNILKIIYSYTNDLHMDIYFVDFKDGKIYDEANEYWIKNRISIDDVYPLKKAKLYDLDIFIPKNETKVLQDTYGNNCLEHAYKKYSMLQEKVHGFEPAKINKDMMWKA